MTEIIGNYTKAPKITRMFGNFFNGAADQIRTDELLHGKQTVPNL